MKISRNHHLPPEGEHTATFVKYEDLGLQVSRFGKKQQVKLVFDIDGTQQSYWANVSLHPDSNLHAVAKALLGGNPPEELELDDLVGSSCLVSIVHYTSPKGTRAKISKFRGLDVPF